MDRPSLGASSASMASEDVSRLQLSRYQCSAALPVACEATVRMHGAVTSNPSCGMIAG